MTIHDAVYISKLQLKNEILSELVDLLADLNEYEIRDHIEDGTLNDWLKVLKHEIVERIGDC